MVLIFDLRQEKCLLSQTVAIICCTNQKYIYLCNIKR